jgi:hypothetical protein
MTKIANKIPVFKNIQEEADFWDTHDTADFESDFKPADVKFVRSTPLSVRFDAQTLSKLKRRAREKGMGTSILIRMWILERLNGSSGKPCTV